MLKNSRFCSFIKCSVNNVLIHRDYNIIQRFDIEMKEISYPPAEYLYSRRLMNKRFSGQIAAVYLLKPSHPGGG